MNETPVIPELLLRGNGGEPQEQRFKFRHVNAITGTFVLIVIGLLIAVVLWTGRSQRWFKSSVELRIILPALFASASCCIGGLGVAGSVKEIPQATQRALTRSVAGLFVISAVVSLLTYLRL